jgi:hypothetical protein
MASGITFTSDTLTKGITELNPKIHSQITLIAEYYADYAEAHMRRHAPWTDRTTNARNGLFGRAFTNPDHYVIVVYHTMPYGIWLEVRSNGRYAIILPTIETVGPRVMRGLRKLLRSLK